MKKLIILACFGLIHPIYSMNLAMNFAPKAPFLLTGSQNLQRASSLLLASRQVNSKPQLVSHSYHATSPLKQQSSWFSQVHTTISGLTRNPLMSFFQKTDSTVSQQPTRKKLPSSTPSAQYLYGQETLDAAKYWERVGQFNSGVNYYISNLSKKYSIKLPAFRPQLTTNLIGEYNDSRLYKQHKMLAWPAMLSDLELGKNALICLKEDLISNPENLDHEDLWRIKDLLSDMASVHKKMFESKNPFLTIHPLQLPIFIEKNLTSQEQQASAQYTKLINAYNTLPNNFRCYWECSWDAAARYNHSVSFKKTPFQEYLKAETFSFAQTYNKLSSDLIRFLNYISQKLDRLDKSENKDLEQTANCKIFIDALLEEARNLPELVSE